jgi:hypothetical protein
VQRSSKQILGRAIAIAGLLGAFGLGPVACGNEATDRGLAPAESSSTPESQKDLDEASARRQHQLDEDMQKQQEKDFDTGDAGTAAPSAPSPESQQ